MAIIKRIKQLVSVTRGYLFKWRYDIIGFDKLPNLHFSDNTPQLVVSLTSYGRRVTNVVPYTLVSLLKQSRLPDRIVLWLDQESWSPDNLPRKIKSLVNHGIEVRLCKDVRSYTKLLPALQAFPDDIIITVDDDIIYNADIIESLYKAHLANPTKICTQKARYPSVDSEGNVRPYDNWHIPPSTDYWLMPLGVYGVLYPPHCLHPDVCKEELFRELCPLADDIWFWIMALRRETGHIEINPNRNVGYSFDDLYQFLHKGSNLTFTNRKKGYNDKQLKNVCQYFKFNIKSVPPINPIGNIPNKA